MSEIDGYDAQPPRSPPPQVYPDETRWVERAAEGNEEAFTRLFSQYYSMIYAYTFRLSFDVTVAEDLTQSTFIKAARGISALRDKAHFRTKPAIREPGAPDNPRLLVEMERLFGSQLEAVVTTGGKTEVRLAPTVGSTNDQRIGLSFATKSARWEILTYSGQKICVNVDGRPHCFEVLADGEGEVLLVGDTFVWGPGLTSSASDPRWHIHARLYHQGGGKA